MNFDAIILFGGLGAVILAIMAVTRWSLRNDPDVLFVESWANFNEDDAA